MVCGREKAGTSGEPISHGLCGRCAIATPQYRGGTIAAVRKNSDLMKDLKDGLKEEMAENTKWIPPEDNPNWKDVDFAKENLEFYEELRREVESEINIGLKR